MTDPLPIRPGIVPQCDAEREMVDYVSQRVMLHSERVGEPCDTVAIFTESAKGRIAHSFSLKRPSDRAATCAVAGAMFLKRATK